ncbi:Fatty-acid amide hydrolase 2 [Dipsacomyces acuminosporus]|nr:Fatty-acid amide hydrolase 2 [Dipsacomyces acuminosporus]
MAVLSRLAAYIILRPLQVLLWAPWRKLAFAYIRWYNSISQKVRIAKQRSVSQDATLDSYNRILLLSATELARRIRAGQLTSERVVTTYIERIKQVNPLLNAVVADRFELAIEEARAADRLISSGSEELEGKPFLGVPITIKESVPVKGMPNTYGLVWRKDNAKYSPASESSKRVENLQNAGFIVLGVTNNPELLMAWESNNTIYGRSCNPYDLSRITGGSSSGEGAIVGAAGSVIGLGTDIGGSIRMPAFFCGVYGHKTTGDWNPKDPTHFLTPRTPEKAACATSGPLCRYAEDIAPFVSAMIGRDIGDPASVDLTKLRVVAFPDGIGSHLFVSDLDSELKQTVIDVANYLGQQVVGHDNVRFCKPPKDIGLAPLSYTPYLSTGERQFAETLGGENLPALNIKRELVHFIQGKSVHTLNSILLCMASSSTGSKTREQVAPFWNKLKADFEELMGDNGVIIFPPHALTAQPHGISYFAPYNFIYTAIFNILGFVVTQVPIGLSKDGLPLGVQVVAPKNQDLKTIAVAIQLEKRFGGWIPPRRFGAPIAESETAKLYIHKQ